MSEDIVLKSVRNCILILVAASMLAACGAGGSSIGPSVTPTNAPQNGGVLSTRMLKGGQGFVNAAGFTVYVFDFDLTDPGHSLCNAGNGCAQNWPHVAPPAGVPLTGQFSEITRDDGSAQLTYAGRPLYTFVGDGAPGQANGDGLNAFGGIWHIARPQGVQASPSPSASPMPSQSPY
jgi:predicted lipoprotein with Yx(FWY)xxD motif